MSPYEKYVNIYDSLLTAFKLRDVPPHMQPLELLKAHEDGRLSRGESAALQYMCQLLTTNSKLVVDTLKSN